MKQMQIQGKCKQNGQAGLPPASGRWCGLEIPSTLSRIPEAEEAILRQCEKFSYTDRDLFALKLALDEAIANAVKHGNKMDSHKNVHIKYRVTSRRVDVVVGDEGPGFNPANLPDPTDDGRLDCPGGRGILLMRAFMNNVVYNPSGNSVTLTKFNESPRRFVSRNVAFA